MKKIQPPLEKREDTFIRKLYRAAGLTVVTYSQSRNTMQTPGIPDLQAFDHKSGTWFYHEVKRQRGPGFLKVNSKQSLEQMAFQAMCHEFGIEYICGARDVAEQKLRELGRIV